MRQGFMGAQFYIWYMSVRALGISAVCIMLLLFSAGCTSLAVNTVRYDHGNLSVSVTNSGNPVDAGVQVRIFQVNGLSQQEREVTGAPAYLPAGTHLIDIPVQMEPGSYKLYVYLTINGERQTAVIRDMVV
jgi:urease beta subunit